MRAITASQMWQPSALNPLVCLWYTECEVTKANEKDTAQAFGLNLYLEGQFLPNTQHQAYGPDVSLQIVLTLLAMYGR